MATIEQTSHDADPVLAPLPPPGRRMAEDEFVTWCRDHQGVRAEWVNGGVVVMSPASVDHVDLADFLIAVMRIYVEQHDLGRVFAQEYISRFRSGERTLRRLPDIMFVARDRLNLIRPTYLDGPPDLVVEVVSPDSVARDYREKYLDYQAAGVREYWIVDPLSRTLEASRLEDGAFRRVEEAGGRVASGVLPGFFLRPEWLWQQPLPRVRDVLRDLGV